MLLVNLSKEMIYKIILKEIIKEINNSQNYAKSNLKLAWLLHFYLFFNLRSLQFHLFRRV